jgi:hypothetical protein
MPKDSNVFVVVGEGVVTVKREGSNRAVLAKVLGKVQVDGVEVLCLTVSSTKAMSSNLASGRWQGQSRRCCLDRCRPRLARRHEN